MAPTQETFQEMLQEKLRAAIRLTMATVLEEELEAYLLAGRYERTPNRRDQRNGYYSRGLGTELGQIEALPVPRTKRSCLNATNDARKSWTRPFARCLLAV